MIKTSIKA